MPENCYIHIPFCKSKCKYCAFVSYPCADKISEYIYALLKEISVNYAGEALKTLYIGGGTPSLLPVDLLKKIITKFNFASNPEITIELNPDDVSPDKIKNYLSFGINRISLGVQSLDDDILSNIGRRHNSIQALDAVDIINNAGCKNISIDLIYGLPNQDLKKFLNNLEAAVLLPIKHLSLYGLKIEEYSFYCKHLPKNLPDDDAQADMYIKACEILENYGFNHYEISNFAKNGYESKHNLNYWNNNSYYGFGAAAHGYIDGYRYYNTSLLENYMQTPQIGEYAHYVTKDEQLEEEIFLGLRKSGGINIEGINKKFNIDFLQKYKHVLAKYSNVYLILDNQCLKFTNNGFLISTVILSDFMI